MNTCWNLTKLRYRIHDKSSLVSILVDRSAFDKLFCGKNPNKPIGGILEISEKKYVVTNYLEFKGNSYSENEFHELEQDWFAQVIVDDN